MGMAAINSLLSLLDARAAAGDEVCGLAAQALRREKPECAPDAMAAAVDRLVFLVREQEAQIRA